MMNATCHKLFEILSDGVADQICIGAEDLASGVDLDAGQQVTWLATAKVAGSTVHIFFCEAEGEDEQFVNTLHGHAGQLIDFSGPFRSYAEARREAAPASAGWTEI
jgi:hypothetical protein